MPYKWDGDAERRMLLYIVKHCDVKPTSEIFNGAAEMLGEGVNANACSQKFYKLKREAEALLTNSGAETPSTPSAKKKSTPSAKTSTEKGRKRKADAEAEEGGEDTAQTPSKRAKKENGTEAAAENGGCDDKSGDDQD